MILIAHIEKKIYPFERNKNFSTALARVEFSLFQTIKSKTEYSNLIKIYKIASWDLILYF